MPNVTIYHKESTKEVSDFIGGLTVNSVVNGTFDSTEANDFVSTAINQSNHGAKVPENLQKVLDVVDDDEKNLILHSIYDSTISYQREHGHAMPADVMEQALHSAYSVTPEAKKAIFDATGTSLESSLAYQPNRAVVAILTTTTQAIPFAHYLPADIHSNESILAILEHIAGSTTGAYTDGDILDGGYSGDTYISSSRNELLTLSGDAMTGKVTAILLSPTQSDPSAPEVPLLRGRSIVYVNGKVAAREVSSSGKGPSSIAGVFELGGVNYTISGTIDTDKGDIALKSSPAFPVGTMVLVEAFLDYERQPSLTPSIITQVETFNLYASPWRALSQQSIDSRTQMNNELGLDPYSEGLIAIQAQFSNERHYDALRKMKRLGQNMTDQFDFAWATQGEFKNRATIWNDFSSVLGALSQRMSLATLNHGITNLYVGQNVAAQFQGLPSNIWQSSGIHSRAGIYRLGRLFNLYDVYYSPKVVEETQNSAEILCIGRATDVTRNPLILGDAVSPTVIPLATQSDLKTGAGYYARNYTSVNPHKYSSNGAAIIFVTNLF